MLDQRFDSGKLFKQIALQTNVALTLAVKLVLHVCINGGRVGVSILSIFYLSVF